MSLQFRRGEELQRTGIIPAAGEPIWVTGTKKLYIGDGVSLGGVNILATSAGAGLAWDPATQTIRFSGLGTGIINVQADTNPTLGGNLILNSRNITGTGNISISGTVTATQFVGMQNAPTLTQNLSLNSRDITGTGNINITGAITSSGTVTAGSIFTAGTLRTNTGLGGNLSLNNYDITGTGDINITGTITSSGTVTAGSIFTAGTIRTNTGLGGNLSLNGFNIIGTGNINVGGFINDNTFTSAPGGTAGQVVLRIGSTTKVAQVSIVGDTNGYPLQIKAVSDASGGSGIINIAHIGGTPANPTTVVNNRNLGGIEWTAYNGVNFVPSSILFVETADTNITALSTQITSKISIGNTNEIVGGTGKYLSIDSKGVVGAAVFQCKTYTTGTLPSAPQEGWIAYDITTHQFKGWNGTSWAVLG